MLQHRGFYTRLAWNTLLFLVPALIASEIFADSLEDQRFYFTIAAIGMIMSVLVDPKDDLKELASFIDSDSIPQAVKKAREHMKNVRQQWDKLRADSEFVCHPISTHPGPPRFEPDDPKMLSYLQKHGLCMISPAPVLPCLQIICVNLLCVNFFMNTSRL